MKKEIYNYIRDNTHVDSVDILGEFGFEEAPKLLDELQTEDRVIRKYSGVRAWFKAVERV